HTGPAIVETKGADVSLVGEARSVAVRLKDVVTAGQAVCTESTRRVLRGKFDFTSLGRQKIKGIEQPVELFQVMGLVEPSSLIESVQPVELTPLTGRDLELSLLKDRWEQAEQGAGQVMLLIGEAGLGKSRLVDSIKEHVLAQAKGGSGGSPPGLSLAGYDS